MSDEDKMEIKTEQNVKQKEDKLFSELKVRNESKDVLSFYQKELVSDYPKDFTWRDLFLKLCFE